MGSWATGEAFTEALVNAMDKCKDNTEFVSTACMVLGNLAASNAGKDRAWRHGGVQIVVQVFGRNVKNAQVCKAALAALNCLAKATSNANKGLLVARDLRATGQCRPVARGI
jgi:hypothetical protein